MSGIHVNTVRFYEDIGFITKPVRKKNGYRIFTPLQLEQCKLIRVAMKSEVLQNGLRNKAVEIVRLCAAVEFTKACVSASEYADMIDAEIQSAREAIASVNGILNGQYMRVPCMLSRKEAASALKITVETIRTWERSGLLCEKRSEGNKRVYNADDMERLNIVRTLRCASYSLSAILRLLNRLDKNAECSVEEVLNTPDSGDEIISVCDRLITSLNNTKADALTLICRVNEIREKFSTLQ